MPEVTRTSAAVWMTQHRSYGRSIPLRSCRPGGVARCISNICRNLFVRKLSVILSIWGKKSLFSVKTSTNYLLSTCYANTDLLWGTWWYSPTEMSYIYRLESHHSCTLHPFKWFRGYSSVCTYPTRVALPFLTCPGSLPFINTTALPALQSHLLNTM